ncbi:MAG: UDP-4-amino-4,6-dideoxy-N-acetyl-beta-L-altrosamine transaminase [Alphaproteobacteria bacterium]|nr:UDP-4-amino-4,6-dideoxy-N-acetyl-beta-L-altrosamine transaminase [Alphaproteobacteria bacterium]
MKTYAYGKQNITEDDIKAVVETLKSPYLTCGPKVKEFEQAICDYTGAKYAVAVNSATSGLHIAMMAAGVGVNDEVITSPMTFLASANCARFCGANVKFADVEKDTANIDHKEIEKQITSKTKAVIPVHFAGQSCDMQKIYEVAKKHNLYVIEDAAHAIGSEYKGKKVGCCEFSDMTVFSFHPVKTITTAEGGAVVTNSKELYDKLCAFRAHGMHKDGEMVNTWEYEMRELGYNYRMTDVQAALGISQLKRLDDFKKRRREIVEYYNKELNLPHLIEKDYSNACFHLYPILVEDRKKLYSDAREVGLYLQVHYIPVHTQPYYRELGYNWGDYPNAEEYYKHCISLPLYPELTDEDLVEIVKRVKSVL